MTDRWKRVSKEEFEILSKFHPSEVQYFINLGEVGPTKPEGRKYKVRADVGVAKGPNNRKLALGVGAGQPIGAAGKAKVFGSIRKFLKDDLKAGLERGKIVASVANDTGLGVNQIQPIISRLVDQKFLRYVE